MAILSTRKMNFSKVGAPDNLLPVTLTVTGETSDPQVTLEAKCDLCGGNSSTLIGTPPTSTNEDGTRMGLGHTLAHGKDFAATHVCS